MPRPAAGSPGRGDQPRAENAAIGHVGRRSGRALGSSARGARRPPAPRPGSGPPWVRRRAERGVPPRCARQPPRACGSPRGRGRRSPAVRHAGRPVHSFRGGAVGCHEAFRCPGLPRLPQEPVQYADVGVGRRQASVGPCPGAQAAGAPGCSATTASAEATAGGSAPGWSPSTGSRSACRARRRRPSRTCGVFRHFGERKRETGRGHVHHAAQVIDAAAYVGAAVAPRACLEGWRVVVGSRRWIRWHTEVVSQEVEAGWPRRAGDASGRGHRQRAVVLHRRIASRGRRSSAGGAGGTGSRGWRSRLSTRAVRDDMVEVGPPGAVAAARVAAGAVAGAHVAVLGGRGPVAVDGGGRSSTGHAQSSAGWSGQPRRANRSSSGRVIAGRAQLTGLGDRDGQRAVGRGLEAAGAERVEVPQQLAQVGGGDGLPVHFGDRSGRNGHPGCPVGVTARPTGVRLRGPRRTVRRARVQGVARGEDREVGGDRGRLVSHERRTRSPSTPTRSCPRERGSPARWPSGRRCRASARMAALSGDGPKRRQLAQPVASGPDGDVRGPLRVLPPAVGGRGVAGQQFAVGGGAQPRHRQLHRPGSTAASTAATSSGSSPGRATRALRPGRGRAASPGARRRGPPRWPAAARPAARLLGERRRPPREQLRVMRQLVGEELAHAGQRIVLVLRSPAGRRPRVRRAAGRTCRGGAGPGRR